MTKINQSKMSRGVSSRPVTKQQVRQMVEARLENKLYVGTTTTTAGTAGAIIYKSDIALGDHYYDRAGDVIRPNHLDVTISMTDGSTNITRFILVQDSMNAGVAPAVTDIISSASVFAQHNPINVLNSRFKYLLDETVCTSAAGPASYNKKFAVKLKGTISFLGDGGAATSAGKNTLWGLVVTMAGTPTYNLSTTLAFTDA